MPRGKRSKRSKQSRRRNPSPPPAVNPSPDTYEGSLPHSGSLEEFLDYVSAFPRNVPIRGIRGRIVPETPPDEVPPGGVEETKGEPGRIVPVEEEKAPVFPGRLPGTRNVPPTRSVPAPPIVRNRVQQTEHATPPEGRRAPPHRSYYFQFENGEIDVTGQPDGERIRNLTEFVWRSMRQDAQSLFTPREYPRVFPNLLFRWTLTATDGSGRDFRHHTWEAFSLLMGDGEEKVMDILTLSFQSNPALLAVNRFRLQVEIVDPRGQLENYRRNGRNSGFFVAGNLVENFAILPERRPFYYLDANLPLIQKRKYRGFLQEFNRSCSLNECLDSFLIEGSQVGAYELISEQEKFLFKYSVKHIYEKSGIVNLTPEDPTLNCFLMSVIRAQLLTFPIENEVLVQPKKMFQYSFPVIDNEWEFLEGETYSFLKVSETNELQVQLFDTHFSENPGARECFWWSKAALELEGILSQYQFDLNVNDLEEIGQVIADFFDIFVSIYDTECFGKRAWIFYPRGTLRAYVERHHALHFLYLLYDHGHMYPILNIFKYFSIKRADQIRKSDWCPICEKIIGSHKPPAFWEKHVKKCLHNAIEKDTFPSLSMEEMIKKQSQTHIPPVERVFDSKTHKINPYFKRCIYCRGEYMTMESYFFHDCYIPKPSAKSLEGEVLDLWVFDIEAAQIQNPHRNQQLYHVCNLLIMMHVFTKEEYVFENDFEFVQFFLETKKMHGAVFISHNGGAYDDHFIVRCLERLCVQHTWIPSPMSRHKYLQIFIPEFNITFLDFMYFIPGSLKSIAQDFDLEVQKGDFPHRFNTTEQLTYEGCLPPLHSDEDYWCLKTKRLEEDKREIEEFFEAQAQIYCTCLVCEPRNETLCVCGKQIWKIREQIEYYCRLDVQVLGSAVQKYREALKNLNDQTEEMYGWSPPNLDPFCFLTMSQVGSKILLGGHSDRTFANSTFTIRKGQTREALVWMERIAPPHVIHRMNHCREFYDWDIGEYADGYCNGTLYICLDCTFFPCQNCALMLDQSRPHPHYPNQTPFEVYEQVTQRVENNWNYKSKYRVVLTHSCMVSLETVSTYTLKMYEGSKPHDFYFGGRTEVFKLYARSNEEYEIKYIDVCSLYPYVCAMKELPVGPYQHLYGDRIERDRLFHPDPELKYWGYIRCTVSAPSDTYLGLLPLRSEGRLTFPKYTLMTGCWGLDELELAHKHGYQVLEIFEIYHWGPDNRSADKFKGYISYFLRMKQEAEGWKKLGASSATPSEEEKDCLVEELYQENGFIGRIRKEKVQMKKILRSLGKRFLNSAYGKFAQKNRNEGDAVIYGYQQFLELFQNPEVDPMTFDYRQVGSNSFKVHYEYKEAFLKMSGNTNVWIAAKVTEHARCVLHQRALEIGEEKVLYCDTDSLIYLHKKTEPMNIGRGLGKFTDEKKGCYIEEYYAVAPKCYFLKIREEPDLEKKAKGIQLTLANQERIHVPALREMLEKYLKEPDQMKPILCDYFTIRANHLENTGLRYGVLTSNEGEKWLTPVITKRQVVRPAEINWEEMETIDTIPLCDEEEWLEEFN